MDRRRAAMENSFFPVIIEFDTFFFYFFYFLTIYDKFGGVELLKTKDLSHITNILAFEQKIMRHFLNSKASFLR